MRVALVHDWLTGMRGGERVLERIAAMFPDADVFTLVWRPGAASPAIERHRITTSFLQRVPDAPRRYRWLLPLYPAAIESLDLRGYDAVISTSHAVAKSARAASGALHLSYVFTPMRYVWELEREYFPPGRFPWPVSAYVRRTCARLRRWDAATSRRADVMIAISEHVARRIRAHYGRDADVLYPPVELERFHPAAERGEDLLLAGAMAPYKRGDLAIEACRRIGARLVVVGTGPMEASLRRLAGPEVEFLGGWRSDTELAERYARARALLFPGEEDFGIVPVEAMASGCPVVAYGVGGAVETVGRGMDADARARLARGEAAHVPGGVLFPEQTVESLVQALRLLEGHSYDPAALRERAAPFDAPRFDREFRAAFERHLAEFRSRTPQSVPAASR